MLKQLIMVAGLASLAACQTSNPDVVNRYQTQRLSTVQDATVLSLRPVAIDGSQSGVGAVTGAAIGGIAGSNVGGPRTGGIVGIVGLVAGGLIGNAVERDATKQNGVEIVLQLKNGERRSVIQGVGTDQFRVGDPVTLVTTGGQARVMPAPPVATGDAAPYPAYPAYAAPSNQ